MRSPGAMTDRESEPGDDELIGLVLDGQRDVYGSLVQRYQKQLYLHACRMGLDHDTASDLVQDSFVKAYESLELCRDRARFGVWVFRILRNRCLDHLKSPRKRSVPLEAEISRVDIAADPAADAERSELRNTLRQALGNLPVEQREAFVLKHLQGHSYEELAEMTGSSVSAMKMRVHRAREALRTQLADLEAETEM